MTEGATQITGFVPVEIKSQPINLVAKEPKGFVLSSERGEQFNLTSLRLSGEVTGTGRAEIVLDNGLGQELLIYSNIKEKKGNMITGMAVGTGNEAPSNTKAEEAPENAWLMITPSQEQLAEGPRTELGAGKEAVQEKFQHSCVDTCYMEMRMQRGLYYTLKVMVDAGTEVTINELAYVLEV
jgi:hypothetical protein